MLRDDVEVVCAHSVGEAAEEAHEEGAAAGELVAGVHHRGVIDAEAHDLVGEGVAILLTAVHQRHHLLELNMVVFHRASPTAPVKGAVVDVTPAARLVTTGITLDCEYWREVICEEHS